MSEYQGWVARAEDRSDRYGPCSCLDELVNDLVRAVLAALDGEQL